MKQISNLIEKCSQDCKEIVRQVTFSCGLTPIQILHQNGLLYLSKFYRVFEIQVKGNYISDSLSSLCPPPLRKNGSDYSASVSACVQFHCTKCTALVVCIPASLSRLRFLSQNKGYSFFCTFLYVVKLLSYIFIGYLLHFCHYLFVAVTNS